MRRQFIGETIGRLSVLSEGLGKQMSRDVHKTWVCKCVCGEIVERTSAQLSPSYSRLYEPSCGCAKTEKSRLRFQTHGMAPRGGQSLEYGIWKAMRRRCNNPHIKDFKHYGGRGISVCDRWSSFPAFMEDMGPRPTDKHSIDRIDVNGNYEPANCRWATPKQQRANRRDSLPKEECVVIIQECEEAVAA